MNRVTLHATGVALLVLALTAWPRASVPSRDTSPNATQSALPVIVINNNLEPAGTLTDGVLELELEILKGSWHILCDDRPAKCWRLPSAESPVQPGTADPGPAGHRSPREGHESSDTTVVIRGLGARHEGVLQEGDLEPVPDSVRLPGSTLVLRKGEPTSIRVLNRTDEHTQVHWHGLEIESYFDGVAGFGGYPERLTPAIAPGDSFEIRITPPRAGSYMYHTHVSDLRQQGSGLYGAFIVLDEGEEWDPDIDRVFLFGETPFRDDEVPVLNGANPPEPITLRIGTTYRFRFMNITLNRPNTVLRLLSDGFPVLWRPIAKDGFDLFDDQQRLEPSERRFAVGETYDYAFRTNHPGDLYLELRTGAGVLLVDQLLKVIE